ncbi:putative membrane protein [Emiliania huxleyi virus 18]|nr:putative membrane protein [Emiliania huxleyi virus 18]
MNSGILALLIGTGLPTNTENTFMQVVSAAILTTLPLYHSLIIIIAFAAFATLPLLSSMHAEFTRKRDFIIDLYCRDIIVICFRYIIYLDLSHYMLLLPCLGIFESYSIQNMVDSYDMNPKKSIAQVQIVNHTSLAIVELFALVIGRMLLPLDVLDDTKYAGFFPSLMVIVPAFTLLFDLFADVGFYIIHRNFHETPFLRTFHVPDHHKNTGKITS